MSTRSLAHQISLLARARACTSLAAREVEVARLQYRGQQSLAELQEELGDRQAPFILTNAMDQWPLRWSHADLLQACGDTTVPLEVSWNGGDYRCLHLPGTPSGARFSAGDYHAPLSVLMEALQQDPSQRKASDPVIYLAQKSLSEVLPGLGDAVPEAPPFEEVRERVHQRSIWLGPAGTISPLHCDPYYNLFYQVWGSKYIRIYSPEVAGQLYPFTSNPPLRNTSQVDVEAVDTARFPVFDSVPYRECHLQAGEVLFMTRKAWHYVRAETGSLSVSYWW